MEREIFPKFYLFDFSHNTFGESGGSSICFLAHETEPVIDQM